MTPLDDELRSTLTSRAAALAPAADPMAGIQARAARLHRRRVALSVTGAALAVAAVAVVVPLSVDRDRHTPQPGTTPSVSQGPFGWAYRGNDIPIATQSAFEREWQGRHPGSTFTPLFGQVYEPSATQELVFVSKGTDGSRVGVVQSLQGGPEFLYDEPLADQQALGFLMPGDETARVLLVAAPDARDLTYTDDTSGAHAAMTLVAPGVGTAPAAVNRIAPTVSATSADGTQTVVYRAWDNQRGPDNLLTWGVRGQDPLSPSTLDLRTRFAAAIGDGRPAGDAEYSPLYVDAVGEVNYTVGQVWFRGDAKAYSVSYATGGTNGPEFFLGPVTPTSPWGLAFLIASIPGRSTDLLVVVPRPGIGQVSYSPDDTSAFAPVAYGRSDLNGIGLVDRSRTATQDRLQVLDGDGNINRPLYEGPVAALLCGLRGCG